MIEYTNWEILRNLLLGTRWTVLLFLVCLFGGGILGVVLLFARISENRFYRKLAWGYIEFFQGTPLLMQLFLFFFGLALVGLKLPAWAAASIALICWGAAFLAEIWRGCVESIAKGQWEASASLGMGRLQQMRHVIVPQAMRVAIAPTVGFLVQIIKATALTSIIGFVELAQAGNVIVNSTFMPFTVYGYVALIYFALCWPLSAASKLIEEKLNANNRSA